MKRAIAKIVYVPVYADEIRISDRSRNAVRLSITSPELEEGKYEIRYRRKTVESTVDTISERVDVSDINEIIIDKVGYINTALGALKIRLNDQISGLPRVTFLVKGRIVKVWDVENSTWFFQHSANPAWIVMDMLTHKRYGVGISEGRINIGRFKEWAQFCDQEGLEFNGVFDTTMNVWEAMKLVARAGHAEIVPIGTRYSVAIEKETPVTGMFSVANIIAGSFKETWLPMSERANEFEVTYFDRTDGYKSKSIRIYDSEAISSGQPVRNAAITIFGTTSEEEAIREATIYRNLNRYIRRTIEFSVPLEAVSCVVGDVVYVQHDMVQWGVGGRFKNGSTTTTLNLDRPVTMQTGKTYKVLIVSNSVLRASGTISSIVSAGSEYAITLPGFTTTENVKRLVVNSKDLEVLSVFTVGGARGVMVSDITGISTGQTYELYDTDVVVERNVTNTGSTTESLTLTQALSEAPAQFQHWVFGETEKVQKPFRVKKVRAKSDHVRDLLLLEYDARVYTKEPTGPLTNPSTLPYYVNHATIDGVSEELVRIGSMISTRVEVRFGSTQSSYRQSKVLLSRNGGPFELLGWGSDRIATTAEDADILVFKVVAIDIGGASAPESSAPTYSYTVVGKVLPPSNVSGFQISDNLLHWSPVSDLDLKGYVIRFHRGQYASWGDAYPLHEGVVTDSPYQLPSNMEGSQYTIMIKAVDTTDHESPQQASIVTNLGDSDVSNVVYSVDFKGTGFPGTIVGGVIDGSGNLIADDDSVFFVGDTLANFYRGGTSDDFYKDNFKELTYETPPFHANLSSVSGDVRLNFTAVGQPVKAEFRSLGVDPFYGDDADLLYDTDANRFYRGDNDWLPYIGPVLATTSGYQFRVVCEQGPVQGVISQMTAVMDFVDVIEEFADVAIASGGTRLPITKTYNGIDVVIVTLQGGTTATVAKVIDKDEALGPLIQCFDTSGSPVSATVDARIKGM